MNEIYLKPPKIVKNKLFLSWEPNLLFGKSGYWIEYLNLDEIQSSQSALTEAYLPILLSFCCLGEVNIHLPFHINEGTLAAWHRIFTDTADVLYRKPFSANIVNPDEITKNTHDNINCAETAVLYGGGTESLLTLAKLVESDKRPYLISLWGNNWIGSDPDVNYDRWTLEDKISQEFSLRLIRVLTNFRNIIKINNFYPYLSKKLHFVNAALFLPLNLSLIFPIARQYKLRWVFSGNEKESSSSISYYSISQKMTHNLQHASNSIEYHSMLESLAKIDIIKELHTKYPAMGKYQYSCWKSFNKRWCLNCEKCLRNYLIYKIYGINPASVGMDEEILKRNLTSLVRGTINEVNQNKAVRAEWDSIRIEAEAHNCKEVLQIIKPFYSNLSFRRLYSLLKNS